MTTIRSFEPLTRLDHLIEEVKQFGPDNEILKSPNNQQKINKKKKTIKQLFTAASKFQRNLRRGVYLGCIFYHEDRVLVTTDDYIPVIEIDETFPNSIQADLYWLIKVSCSWNEIKLLRSEIEKNVSSTLHFRTKILSAIVQMQSSLGVQDLGQIYQKPLKDSRGTMVLSTVNYIKSPKSVSLLNARWVPINKVLKKIALSDDPNLIELLMASIQQQISYHQVSSLKLSKGLYLAYLKMQSSVEEIRVVVSLKSPNMLPHCKIRDNQKVTSDEWKYLKKNFCSEAPNGGTESQKTFLELVLSACKRLFNYMELSNNDILSHRIYNNEVIHLSEDTSFIVICPSAEMSCSIPAKKELLLQRGDLLSLPIQVFEFINMYTYKPNVTKKYARLSCILEIYAATANHLHREAFSNSEVAIAKERVSKLQELENELNGIWKSMRWLMNVISFARDRSSVGISLRDILQRDTPFGMPIQTLQLPSEDKTLHTSFGRGSWPGPGNNISSINRISDYSKSEQNLQAKEYSAAPANKENIDEERFVMPSKSENMLMRFRSKKYQRARSNTICNLTFVNGINTEDSKRLFPMNNMNASEFSTSSPNISLDLDESAPFLTNIKRQKSKLISSKSMTNIKQNIISNRFKAVEAPQVNGAVTSVNTDPVEVGENKGMFKNSKGLRNAFNNRNESGIIQVFAAYETGLASGTSLKLHVTPRTTAKEIVDLVVKQLNMAVILKGKEGPVYNPDKLSNFCLVAVIGARERCLRDDFKPLHLQNPWRKGRLYVRQKHDVLAALEHSSRHSTII